MIFTSRGAGWGGVGAFRAARLLVLAAITACGGDDAPPPPPPACPPGTYAPAAKNLADGAVLYMGPKHQRFGRVVRPERDRITKEDGIVIETRKGHTTWLPMTVVRSEGWTVLCPRPAASP